MNKNSKLSDSIGNLYRAALFLAREDFDSQQGLKFAKKAIKNLEKTNNYEKICQKIRKALINHSIDQREQNLVLAEKILDQYLLLK